ncbi:MAG: hypothetical protein LBG92_04945 [Prevotellaceae bacterium]|jgi:hypothetical protein|nr:hypothetical protein [Prevotellaceae bacterium]
MKKFYCFKILFAAFLFVGIVACKSSKKEKQERWNKMIQETEKIGKAFCQTMDSIFYAVEAEKLRLQEHPQLLNGISLKEHITGVAHNAKQKVMQQFYPDIAMSQTENDEEKRSFITRVMTADSIDAKQRDEKIRNLLSPFQQKYYDKIQEIFQRAHTPEYFRQELANVEEQLKQAEADENEIFILLFSISIARHSVEYWCRNIERWAALMNSLNSDVLTEIPANRFLSVK